MRHLFGRRREPWGGEARRRRAIQREGLHFCNAKEVAGFKKNPDFYMPLTLPMALDKFDLTDASGGRWKRRDDEGQARSH